MAGDVVAADNMILPPSPEEREAYRRAIGDMESFLLPIGRGGERSKKRGG